MGVRVTFGLLRVAAPEPDRNRVAAVAAPEPNRNRVAAPEPNQTAYLQRGGPPITEADFFETDAWGYPKCILCGKGADDNHVNSKMHIDRIQHPWDYLTYDTRLGRYVRG